MNNAYNLLTFQDAGQFLSRTQTYLEAHEAINSLMLGVCLRLARHPERISDTPYLASVEKGVLTYLAAMMTPPYNLVLASSQQSIETALEMIADDLITRKWQVPGISAPKKLARTFAELWAAKTGTRYDLEMAQRIYECRAVIPPFGVAGNLRLATSDDIDIVTDWVCAFWEETFPIQRHEFEEVMDLAKTRINDNDIYLWDDDLPVSMAARTRPTQNGISIGFVYTPPQFRNNGYATACVAKLTQTLLSSGYKYCALYTDLANPTSNSIYKKIGYNSVQDVNSYLFSSASQEEAPPAQLPG
jgi:predicted GNAT family acetyltransferase